MSDRISKQLRSSNMRAVRNRNTAPEIAVRKILRSLGIHYTINRSDLPGSPDIVLTKYRVALFVHGCFWHGHSNCTRSRRPKSNVEFWNSKLDRNIDRDKLAQNLLIQLGWNVETIWECETRNKHELENYIRSNILQKYRKDRILP